MGKAERSIGLDTMPTKRSAVDVDYDAKKPRRWYGESNAKKGGQDPEANEVAREHYTWHNLNSAIWSIPRQPRCLPEATDIRLSSRDRPIQNQWCSSPTCQPSVRHCHITKSVCKESTG